MSELVAWPVIPPEHRDEVMDLRWRVLRKPYGLPRGTEADEYEAHSSAMHAATFVDGRIVSTARIHHPDDTPDALCVRFVATEPAYRGQGLGREAIERIESLVIPRFPQVARVILNAKTSAATFYEGLGYTRILGGETMDYNSPHVWMQRIIEDRQPRIEV